MTNLCIPQNFVGLTVSDGYIACGSETNEVPFHLFIHCRYISKNVLTTVSDHIVYFRSMLTINLSQCLLLPINLAPLIPFLETRQKMTTGNLFQVYAGEGNQTWLLLLIRVDVSKFCRWFDAILELIT